MFAPDSNPIPSPLLQVRNVSKVYRRGTVDVSVLKGVSCDIPAGRFTFIVGPSGSGKSSLLYLLGALDEPTSGEICVDGRSLATWTATERDRFRQHDVGFIFQSFNLLDNLSALDNVLVPFLPTGISSLQRQAAEDLLRQVGLADRIDHRPQQLSGGEQQRVAIARALLKRPRLVLADEPTGELDSETGQQVFAHLRELQHARETTVVVVTHDHRYIQPGDHVLEIRDGRIAPTDRRA
ncbi:MAG: ABC transporter ATP-binding protein [Planctomycetaceae bacterium]